MFEGIKPEVISTTRFDEKLDLSTKSLGRIGATIASKIKVEERILMSEQGYMTGKY